MTTEHEVMTFLERADPARPGDDVTPPLSARRYLETRVQQRSTTMSVLERTDDTTKTPRPRWPIYAAAAAVLGIVIGAIALLSRGDDEPVPVTTVVPTVTTPETVPPIESTEGAQSAVSELFAAYNGGDTDAVLALMSDDVIWTENYGTGRPGPDDEPLGRDDVELRFAWNNAQGEQWSEAVCELADEQRPAGLTLDCRWDTLDALIIAVDGNPIPTRALVVVADGEVSELHLGYTFPDFATLGAPFDDWLEANHPAEADFAGCCGGSTREESVAMGEARAVWAGEWAAYRAAFGCSGLATCTLGTPDWVAEYDAICTAAGTALNAEAVEQLRALPPHASRGSVSEDLMAADEELITPGLDGARVAELQQTRLDAMVALGVDEACYPDLG